MRARSACRSRRRSQRTTSPLKQIEIDTCVNRWRTESIILRTVMRRHLLVVGIFVAIFSVSGAAIAQSPDRNSDGQIDIRGKEFLKDGKPWLPKGVTVEGYNRPAKLRDKGTAEATSYYGSAELSAIRQVFRADIIRIQVSQPGLDPRSPIYESEYPAELLYAVKLARSAGFVVIISMDAQAENGIANLPCMPNDSTVRAWRSIAPSFIHDSGIIFELFNEPCKYEGNPKNKTDWAQTMQVVIDDLRSLGATNILLLDGLGFGHSIEGLFPMVHDKLRNRLALTVHPYLVKNNYVTVDQWRKAFGNDAKLYPAIAGEWNATPTNGCVDNTTPEIALSLMRYLESLQIGLIGWGIDSNYGKLVKDHTKYEPTDFSSFNGCTKIPSASGGGRLLANYPDD